VSVDFGKPKTAWYGKTKLAKAIHQNGFGLTTSLSISEVGNAIELTCKQYPEKKEIFRQIKKPVTSLEKGYSVISYGVVYPAKKTGREIMHTVYWKLGLAGPVRNYEYRIVLVRATLHSGQIDEVEELGHFINELEQNLRNVDPDARIDLVGLEQ
jgi:hypothetical protein